MTAPNETLRTILPIAGWADGQAADVVFTGGADPGVPPQPAPKQAWDNTEIAGPWLNLMRNALNAQIWSFKHPDFLAVSATHGSAHLALYDQAMWDKYKLTHLAGGKFKTNTLIEEKKAASADAANFEDPAGAFSPADNSIPALMRRGVVFMSCHHALWEQAAALIEAGSNPDKLAHEELAAELTNHP